MRILNMKGVGRVLQAARKISPSGFLQHLNILVLDRRKAGLLLLLALLLGACRTAAPAPLTTVAPALNVPTAGGTASVPTAVAVIASPTATPPAVTPSPSLPPTATPEPTATPTPDPYAHLSIEALSQRSYGGGEEGGGLEIQETLAENSFFTRALISYPSDGLAIYGFMNLPKVGEPPFPVVIALHGYIDPAIYTTIDYTTRYADALARAGFLVIHPNLRGYPPSDDGDNLFRVGMAIDVLNLIGLVKQQAGQPGPLEMADPQAIGLWGHSMGGGISTRVITISKDVRAAVLYGAMSGDEQKNFERIFSYFSNGARGLDELNAPPEIFPHISPIFYLDRIQAAVSIHHGKVDPDVPLAWSIDLCNRLNSLGKIVECYTYPGQAHTFYGEGDELFMQRMIDFYSRYLK